MYIMTFTVAFFAFGVTAWYLLGRADIEASHSVLDDMEASCVRKAVAQTRLQRMRARRRPRFQPRVA